MKTVEEIYQGLLESYAARTGGGVGDDCELAARLYAAAAELQALSIQADWVLDQSFPQTAAGTYLDYHAQARGLSRTAATQAKGVLRFFLDGTAAADRTVEKGTVCMTAGEVRFQTTEDGVLPAGQTQADIPAEAVEPGTGGNVPAGTVTIMSACPVGVTAVTNPAAFTGGCAAEDDESLRARILESYQRLPNGANAAWYETTAMSHDGVAAARAVGRARGIGTVDVYLATAAGAPDDALLAEVQADLAARREIAVDVEVKAPATKTVDVSVEIAAADISQVRETVGSAIAGYFTGRRLGRGVLLAELGNLIYAVEGVENYHLLAPTADLAAEDTVLPVLGTVRVTEMET